MADVLPSDELTDDEPSDFGSLRPGTRLGRYELLVPIARGGMARVWAALQHGQRGFQKLVAIKTILPHLAEEPEFERMFLDEARIASGVHHPNVCEIYELGEERRTLYLAMEWVTGDSLSRMMRASGQAEALDPRVVARIIADACGGVHAAHELKDDDGRELAVVHRDLSPHNILLTGDGVAKVCDFGVAKALGQLHEETSAGQLKGKISYMSPEQVTGTGLDRRSDVFSLGCVLYEASTGVRPFKGDRDHQIMHAILHSELEPPSNIVRNYPAELERIVLRALAHQPILRYPSAERMRFALEEFLTKGQLITTANVAQVVRSRIGEQLERRKERIKHASSVAEQNGWDPGNAAPSRDPRDHRSGVKPSQRQQPVAALNMQMSEGSGAPPPMPPPTMSPSTPRLGTVPPVDGGGNVVAPVSVNPMSGTPLMAIVDNEQTLHGHSLGNHPLSASSPTIPHGTGGRIGASTSNEAPVTLTLPMAPGAVMAAAQQHPQPEQQHLQPEQQPQQQQQHQQPQLPQHQPQDFSNFGQVLPSDWSTPNHTGPFQPLTGPFQPLQPLQQQLTGPFQPLQPQMTQMTQMTGPFQPLSSAMTIPPTSGPVSANPTSPYTNNNPAIYDPENSVPPSLESSPDSADGQPAGAGQYAMAAFVGLLFAVLIGGGGFFIWHTRTTHVPMPPIATTPTFTPPVPATTTTTPEALSASGGAAPATATTATASPEIAFHVTPADATLVIDGREIGQARTVPRPAAGQTVTLVARAKGFDDTTLQIDYFTNASMEIALKPIIEIDGPAQPAPAVSTAASALPSASASAKPHKPRPKDPNGIPDNPY